MFSRVLGMLAAATRPMRVFHDAGPARDWILKQPPGKSAVIEPALSNLNQAA
jgi:hypothetical protein